MDDSNLGGPAESIFADGRKCITELIKIGLEVNPSKCEVIKMSYPVDEFTELVTTLAPDLPGLKRTELADVVFLGSAIIDLAAKKAIASKLHTYHLMTHRLQQLDTHTGFFFLKNALSLPRLLFLHRSSPCYRHSDDLVAYDECTAESICNVQFDDTGWKQAKLPVRFAGLGHRSADDQALPANLSSRESCRRLVSAILPPPSDPSVENADDVITTWAPSGLKILDDPVRQSNLDTLHCSALVTALKPILSQHRLACFVAATCKESGACLNCLPSTAIGCRLDNDSLRIAVSIRLGLRVSTPHRCRCGSKVDEYGLHPLYCRFSIGRLPRHTALYDVIRRSLQSAGIPALLERWNAGPPCESIIVRAHYRESP